MSSDTPKQAGKLRREFILLMQLALPMMVAQGGLMLMGVVDTFIIGGVGASQMAGVALGNSVAGIFVATGVGISMGIEPLIAQAVGAGERDRALSWLGHGLWLAAASAPVIALLIAAAPTAFAAFDVPTAVGDTAAGYMYARVPGVFFNCAYTTFRAYLSGTSRVRPLVLAVLSANVVNAILDIVLVRYFSLGAVAIGIASSVCWAWMAGWVFFTVKRVEGRVPLRRFDLPSFQLAAKLGIPVGLQLGVEVGIFSAVSVLIARFGEIELAGHQIAMTLASFTFMMTVGVSVAASVRVGHYIGQGNTPAARSTGLLSIGVGAAMMAIGGCVFILFGDQLGYAFAPKDPQAAAVASALLVIAALFSVSDGIQVVAAGCLRGAGDTRWPFWANAGAHWLVGLPMALWLGNTLGLRSRGYWWALTIGLTGVAVILLTRFWQLTGRPVARVEIRAPR